MIKYVVIEDNLKFQSEVIEVIEKLMFKTNFDYLVEKFAGYTPHLGDIIKDCSIKKVYILDIELDKIKSGIEIAQEIRRVDWDSEIIFITSHDKMFELAHRTVLKTFDFIEKYHSLKSRLEQDIKLIIAQKNDYGKFAFISNKLKMQVYLKDITHIYRDTIERKLVIKTTNSRFLTSMTISDILKELDSRFRQVHRACIVNTDRVNIYCWPKGYFVLDTSEQVDLCSKTFKENVCV